MAAATPLARAAEASVVLVRLVNPTKAERSLVTAENHVASTATRLERAGLEARGLALRARPAVGIVAAANEVDADLIVMSTHARGGALRSVLGSVADEVVRKSHRPVLLLRRDSDHLRSGTATTRPPSGSPTAHPAVADGKRLPDEPPEERGRGICTSQFL